MIIQINSDYPKFDQKLVDDKVINKIYFHSRNKINMKYWYLFAQTASCFCISHLTLALR